MNNPKNIRRWRFASAFLFTSIAPFSLAQTYIWNGGGTDNNWTTPANWQGNTSPPSANTTAIQLAGTTRLNINVGGAFTFGQLAMNNGTGAFTLTGAELSIASRDTAGGTLSADSGNAVRNNSSSLLTINNNLKLLNGSGIYAVNGNITLGGNIDLNGNNLRLIATSGKTLTLNGVISGSATDIAYNNGGTFLVNGANTYTSTTKIWHATVVANHASAFSTGTVELGVNVDDTARTPTLLTGQALTISNNIRIISQVSGGSTSATIGSQHTSGTTVFSGTVTMGSNAVVGEDLTVTAAGSSRVNFTGNLQRASGATGADDTLTKTGTGIVALSGANNTYSGITDIKEGTLLINGVLTANGEAVTVRSGATLGGAGGQINRDVNLLSGSFLEVGDNNAGITGVITVTGALSLASGATVKFDLGANAITSDRIQVNGNLNLGTVTFDLTTLSGFGQSLSYTLLTVTGEITGSITDITLTGSPLGDYTLQLQGNSINLVSSAIPEPASAALLVGGGVLMGALLRRRRQG